MTQQEVQAYNALQKWATRLNKREFVAQLKRNKKKPLKVFCPNPFALTLTSSCNKLLVGEISADEAMSILSSPLGRAELDMCMDDGF